MDTHLVYWETVFTRLICIRALAWPLPTRKTLTLEDVVFALIMFETN